MPETNTERPDDITRLRVLPSDRPDPLDVQPELQALREACPFAMAPFPAGLDGWVVTRHQDVRAVLLDTAHFSSRLSPGSHWDPLFARQGLEPPENRPGYFIRLDGPAHAAVRRRVAADLGPKRLQALREPIQQMVDDLLDGLSGSQLPVDFLQEFTGPVSSRSISILLGVPEPDRPALQAAVRQQESGKTVDDKLIGWNYLRNYLEGLIPAKRAEPGDDLVSRLVAGDDASEDPLGDAQLAALVQLLFSAGHHTTVEQIALSILLLLQHPDQLHLLRTQPGLIDQAVEELHRYTTVVQYGIPRYVTADTENSGHAFRPGELVVPLLSSANRDPRAVTNPDRLDITRPRTANQHFAFGFGPHQCVGQHLARLELNVALTAVLARIPTLRLAGRVSDLEFRYEDFIYGLEALPVSWDEILPRAAC